mgnify:CR=1 FL=1
MKPKKIGVITALVLCVSLGIYNALYTVSEVQQVIITQFGKPIGEPVVDAAVDSVRRITTPEPPLPPAQPSLPPPPPPPVFAVPDGDCADEFL